MKITKEHLNKALRICVGSFYIIFYWINPMMGAAHNPWYIKVAIAHIGLFFSALVAGMLFIFIAFLVSLFSVSKEDV